MSAVFTSSQYEEIEYFYNNRDISLKKMQRALDDLYINGIKTSVEFSSLIIKIMPFLHNTN